jgi:Ca2+-binding EF-hand superfamily protein
MFAAIIEVKEQLECSVDKLAQNERFNLYETFRFFDADLKGAVTFFEFLNGIKRLLKS